MNRSSVFLLMVLAVLALAGGYWYVHLHSGTPISGGVKTYQGDHFSFDYPTEYIITPGKPDPRSQPLPLVIISSRPSSSGSKINYLDTIDIARYPATAPDGTDMYQALTQAPSIPMTAIHIAGESAVEFVLPGDSQIPYSAYRAYLKRPEGVYVIGTGGPHAQENFERVAATFK